MSDGVVLNAGTGGDTVMADDLGAAGKAQGVKVVVGDDGTNGGYVSSSNPLPVSAASLPLPSGAAKLSSTCDWDLKTIATCDASIEPV